MNRTSFATLLLFACPLLAMSGGCTKTVITKIASHEIGGPAVAQRVPSDGVYRVKWADESRKFQRLEGTECLVWKGDHVGFEPTPDGKLVAFAGKERIPLAMLPPD